MFKIHNSKDGQIMLMSVLTIGAVMLGATAIAGFLVLYQIRMSTNASDSAKAIFAADAGIEWGIYAFTNPTSAPPPTAFSNGASFNVVCKDDSGNTVQCTNASTSLIRSSGYYGSVTRVFELGL
jgi:Tfp pilus assembly protein PilX